MSQSNLGQVRDKITSIVRTQGTGQAGQTDTYTIYTECSPSGAGTFQVTNGADGSPRKVASGVSSFICRYGVPYLIKIVGDNAYVPIEGTDYYGSFFFTNYSYRTTATQDVGVTGRIGLHKRLMLLGKKVEVIPDLEGTILPTVTDADYTLTATSGTLDVYVLD